MTSPNSAPRDGPKKIFHFKKESIFLECEWDNCSEVFPTMQSFLDHIQAHMEMQPSNELACLWKDCGHSMSVPEEFIIHNNYHAFHTKIKSFGTNLLKRKNSNECSLSSVTRNIIPVFPGKFVCNWDNCDETFCCPERYYTHVDEHVGKAQLTKCLWEDCEVVATNGYKLREHLRCHTQEKQIACPTCGGVFSNRTKFFDHVKRQGSADEKLFQCSFCGKKLTTMRLLKDHMRNHINYYQCPLCDMTCCSPSNLSNHIKYRHSDDRSHHCNFCEYSGKSQGDLCRHLETHLRDPQHKCDIEGCKFVTRNSTTLKIHLKTKHNLGEIANYTCHLCPKRYTRGTYLTRHLFKAHAFRWPSGHRRFRYKRGEDGNLELERTRYESTKLTEIDSIDEDIEMIEDDDSDNEFSVEEELDS